jgi:hypothetical protein
MLERASTQTLDWTTHTHTTQRIMISDSID